MSGKYLPLKGAIIRKVIQGKPTYIKPRERGEFDPYSIDPTGEVAFDITGRIVPTIQAYPKG
jgi:hypothetical protein